MKKRYLGIMCAVALMTTTLISPITASACTWGENWGNGGQPSWGGGCNGGGQGKIDFGGGGNCNGGEQGKIDFGGGGNCNGGEQGKIDFGGGGNCNGGEQGKIDFGGGGNCNGGEQGKIDFGGGGNCNGGGTGKIDFGGGGSTGGFETIKIDNFDKFSKTIQGNANVNINITASFTINCPININNTVNIFSTNGSCIKAGGDFCSGGKYEGCGIFNIDKGGMFNIGNGTGKCDFKIDQNTAIGPCINVTPSGGCEINKGIEFINNFPKDDPHHNSSCVIINKEEESSKVKIDAKVDVNGKTISTDTFTKDYVDCVKNTKTKETTTTNQVPSIANADTSVSPKTGDEFPFAVVISIVAVAVIGMVTTVIIIKKKKK